MIRSSSSATDANRFASSKLETPTASRHDCDGSRPNRADRLLIRPASGRQAGTGLSTRTHHSQDTRVQGHPLTESQAKSTDTNLTTAPDGTTTHSQSSRLSGPDRECARPGGYSRARELHKRLHTHRTFDGEQVSLNEKAPTCGAFAEPSDGLEPSTPSLPSQATGGSRWQRISLISAVYGRRRFAADCHPLQPRGSRKAPSWAPRSTTEFRVFVRLA